MMIETIAISGFFPLHHGMLLPETSRSFLGGQFMFANRMVGLVALLVGAGLLLSFTSSRLPAQDKKADLTGSWTWSNQQFGQQQEVTLKLKQDGDKITGTISGFQGADNPIQEAAFKDGTLTFKTSVDFGQGQPFVTMYTCKIDGDTIKGKGETIIAQAIDGKRSK
jgi:hypothetical protein